MNPQERESLLVSQTIKMSSKLEKDVASLIEQFRGRLPDESTDEYISLVQHNECRVAIENLCVQLFEHEVLPTNEELTQIRRISSNLKLDEDTWNFLSPD